MSDIDNTNPDQEIVECVFNNITNDNDKIPDVENINKLNGSNWIVNYNNDRYYVRKNGYTYECDGSRSIEKYVKSYDTAENISFVNNYNGLCDSLGNMFVSVKGVCVADKEDKYGRTINYIILDDGFGVSCIVKDEGESLEKGCKYKLYGVDVSSDYGWTLYINKDSVVQKAGTGYRTDYVDVAESKDFNGVSKTVIDSSIFNDFERDILRKTVGIIDGYVNIDKTSFFDNDFVTSGELMTDIFKNTPNYHHILADNNSYLRKIFNDEIDYNSDLKIESYDEYEHVSIYGEVEAINRYNKDNKPNCDFLVNDVYVTVWENVDISEGEDVLILLGQVSVYDDNQYSLNVGDQSVVFTKDDL